MRQEDAERLPQPPPVFKFPCPPTDSPLRRFIALRHDALLVLGPRRQPAIPGPAHNTYTSISISTSVGFRSLEISAYIEAVRKLRPDIAVGIADVEFGDERSVPGVRRKEKMSERSKVWMKGLQIGMEEAKGKGEALSTLWAPILPIEEGMQREYLDYLEEQKPSSFQGIVLYNDESIQAIPTPLQGLPRLSMTEPHTPHQLLISVSLGTDLHTVPFTTAMSEAGIAFSFKFPAPLSTGRRLPLGFDMWSKTHAIDLSPLEHGCNCYACTNHHRAYIQHLLAAKEMLAWVLLQVHNHHVMDNFFAGVRTSIGRGTFSKDVEDFEKSYDSAFPESTGQGPRYGEISTRDLTEVNTSFLGLEGTREHRKVPHRRSRTSLRTKSLGRRPRRALLARSLRLSTMVFRRSPKLWMQRH